MDKIYRLNKDHIRLPQLMGTSKNAHMSSVQNLRDQSGITLDFFPKDVNENRRSQLRNGGR